MLMPMAKLNLGVDELEKNGIQKNDMVNFIGTYQIPDKDLMNNIINFFDNNIGDQNIGKMGGQKIDLDLKNSKEIVITPNNLKEEKYKIFKTYVEYLQKCYLSYLEQWPFSKVLGNLSMGRFQIQKYEIGGHNRVWHTERDCLNLSHRVFAWMTYLNDVENDGETEFLHYGLKIKPEAGKTIIWPAEWTHAHRGNPTTDQEKYIMTGWLSFK